MHAIDVTVIAFQGAGNASVSGTAASLEQVDRPRRGGRPRRRAGRRRRGPRRAGRRRRGRRLGRRARRDLDPGLRRRSPPQLGEAFGQADAEQPDPLRLRRPRGDHDLPRLLHRPAAAARAADRPLRLHRQERRAHQQRLGRRRHPRLRRRRRRPDGRRPRPPGSAGASAASTCRPAATTRCCRRRAVADLMIYAYWSAGARDAARRPDRVLQARRRHPHRRAARQPGRARCYSDPSYAGLECAPFVVAGGSSDRSSVYDNGLAARPHRLDRRRHADRR